MNTSGAGLALIELNEGKRLTMYRDQVGLPTIGVGHLLTKDELTSGKLGGLGIDWHQGITDAQCDALLRRDLNATETAINANVTVGLNQPEFDALASFVFNIGGGAFADSTLLKKLNAGERATVPVQMRRWVYAAGEEVPALITRREREVAMWESRPPIQFGPQ